jgi:hypothetical protein
LGGEIRELSERGGLDIGIGGYKGQVLQGRDIRGGRKGISRGVKDIKGGNLF